MSSRRAAIRKVVVIGLDGLEPKIVEAMMAAGELPHLSKLASQGGFSRVATTSPAQTPVAWSTFATGLNPGGHGIFDFIRRDPATYQPDLALNRHEQKNAWLPPRAVNLRRGMPVWDRLAASGIGSTVLRCPCTYPAKLDLGRMLSGMGVPDLRGGLGTSTFYSDATDLAPREAENVVRLERGSGGIVTAHLVGPKNPKDRATLRAEFTIEPDYVDSSVTIRLGPSDPLVVRRGEWSDWLRVKFKAGLLQSVRGLVRFHLVRLEPTLELYASPINFDPDSPPFPICDPPGFAAELADELGVFHTTGMIEDHAGLKNGRIDEHAFLDQCAEVWNEREAMMLHELERFDEGLFYCLFDTPDRVQHMFWRYREPGHPALGGLAPSPEFAGVIEGQYRRADEAAGRALAMVDDRTRVIVLSDHGFGSFRRGVHLNSWLHDQGLLTLRDGAEPGDSADAFPRNIDWSRTRAYALGLGGIYLNLEGREGQGIVAPADAGALSTEIARGLTGLLDGEHGVSAIRGVKTREELYRGPYAPESPDLVVHFAEGYRVSWSASLGGTASGHFEDNREKWAGDHIVDPALVPGILLMNMPFRGTDANLLDLAPTILDALGLPESAELEGSSLLR